MLLAIESLARRCRDITQTLLRFSQQRAEPDFQDVDLNRVVADALRSRRARPAPRGSPSTSRSPSPPRASAAIPATSPRWC